MGEGESGDGLSLEEAIEQSAAALAADLPAGTRVAIVAFDSEHENLSGYIMDELGGALAEGELEVADRRNLPVVYKELNFQMSGDVSEETAVSIGKFLGAEYVISGQLIKSGDSYRYRLSSINVETAVLESSARFDVRNSRAMSRLIGNLRNAKAGTPAAYKGPASAVIDRGILFAMRGDFELAVADFTEAIRLDGKLAAAYMLRGRAYAAGIADVSKIRDNFSGFDFTFHGPITAEQKAVVTRVIADYTRAIRLDPNIAAAYRDRGVMYSSMVGDYDKAIADYNRAIRLDPNDAWAYTNRGDAYYGKEDYDRAFADYNQAITLDPNDAWAYNNRGIAYHNKKDYDRAIADYTQAIKLDPKYAVAYINRGVAYYNKKDYDRAFADYNQAIRLDPNDAVAYYNRGNAYYDKEDYDRAIADYTQAIKLDPKYAVVYNNRGYAYHGKKDYDRAIADYTQAIRLDPNDAVAYYNRGYAYYDKEDYDRAIADYTQAIKLDPNDAWAYTNRGDAYYYKGDYDRAIADYTQAIRLDPNDAVAYNNRGYAYDKKGDYKRAHADYEQALRLDPHLAYAQDTLERLRNMGY
jgi:tetratricopeptide (TPR) repeat protein